MELFLCIPCQHGDHSQHQEVIEAVSEGMLGGTMCPCKGECQPAPPPVLPEHG